MPCPSTHLWTAPPYPPSRCPHSDQLIAQYSQSGRQSRRAAFQLVAWHVRQNALILSHWAGYLHVHTLTTWQWIECVHWNFQLELGIGTCYWTQWHCYRPLSAVNIQICDRSGLYQYKYATVQGCTNNCIGRNLSGIVYSFRLNRVAVS